MKIKEIFKNLERFKGLIVNYQDNVNYYIDCLNSKDKLIELVERPSVEITNVQKSRNITAPQEIEIFKEEAGRAIAKRELEENKRMRNEIYDKLYVLERSLEYLETLPRGDEMSFVIQCRHVDKMRWSDIENNFNERFRAVGEEIGYNTLNSMNSKALGLLEEYAKSFPFYKIKYNQNFTRIKLKLN